ncbi:MAG: hypothetical protein PHW11_03750 [Anaerolineaceae bacterium]|jgi:hypothetical protein|nr:hypothetical protein [Anaerolineaceae bacterium]MDD4042607.1 hypothetical protein [Anaerolineaceae bacterium]MDD4577208.1 hypothetical protein [Anaerolineaceae bacterium]
MTTIDFPIEFEKKPERDLDLVVHIFDSAGKLLKSAKVKNDQASLPMEVLQNSDIKVVVSPALPSTKKPTLESLRAAGAYEPRFDFDPAKEKFKLYPIPVEKLKLWLFCPCVVKGKVVRPIFVNGSVVYKPVNGAKVHICEVDKLYLLIPHLPKDVLFRFRDELIMDWKKYRLLPRPPIVKYPLPWPPPPPDLFPMDYEIKEPEGERVMPIQLPDYQESSFRLNFMPQMFNYGTNWLNPQPEPPLPEYVTPRASFQMEQAKPTRKAARTPKEKDLPLLIETISADIFKQLQSDSITQVSSALLKLQPMILPYLCWWPWLHKYFCLCDEIATVMTDCNGFETTTWYRCSSDKPDLYFWVEYPISGVWTKVYEPKPVCCHVHWDYECGKEVLLPVTDTRVPWCEVPMDLPGLKVLVKTIGNGLSMSEINKTPGATKGKTTAGEPLAGSLELRLDMSRSNLISMGVTQYRWSYTRRTLGNGTTPVADSWHTMLPEVYRPYEMKVFHLFPIPHFETQYKYEKMGPFGAENLFKIQPSSPAVGVWYDSVMNEHIDLAWAYFDTGALRESDGTTPAAGQYDIKLELFDSSGNLVKWNNPSGTGTNIQAFITNNPAPFVPPVGMTETPAMAANLIKDGSGDTLGFVLTLFVDNTPCEAVIDDPYVVENPSALSGPCGFLFFNSAATSKAHLRFLARQAFDNAFFHFQVVKGSSGAIAAASLGWIPVHPAAVPVNGFNRSPDSHFSKELKVTDLLNANGSICPQAAFAATLGVYSTAYNGYTQAYWLNAWAVPKAFALAPKP